MKVPINFWPAQQKFFESGPQPTMLLAGVGHGKTYVGILKTLFLLDEYPGSRAAIIRKRFQDLKRTTAATLWQLLPPDHIARRNDNEGRLRLTNGSEIVMMHIDKPDSLSSLKSLELNFAYVDQAEDISAEAWDTLWERIGRWSGASKRGGYPRDWPYRNRLKQPIPPRYLFASCYSPGYDHWITSRFWEHGSERARYREEGYQVFTGSTRDNLALSDEYIAGRLAMGDEYVRRYVDAVDWGAHEGRIFDIHPMSILEPTPGLLDKIKNTMKLHRVYDHGEMNPSACLWYATDTEGNVFFYREYGAANVLVSDHRKAIYAMSQDDKIGSDPPHYYSNLADPAIFAKNRGRSLTSAPTWSVADEFTDTRIMDPKTAIYWRRANNDEAMTINRVREYLKSDYTHRHPFNGRIGAPRAFFVRRTDDYPWGCHEVLTDIRSAKREELGTAPDGTKMFGDNRDEKVRDHWLDCVRYAIGMRPALATKIVVEPDEPNSIKFNDYLEMMDEMNRKPVDLRDMISRY